jgi:hypothetical protein
VDEIGLMTWRRARASGDLTPAGLNLLWSFLERDHGERVDHRGAQAWFSAHAPSLADECHTKRHRIHDQVENLTAANFIAHKLRDKSLGTYRVWIRHSEQPVPEDLPHPADPQIKMDFASAESGTPLDSGYVASVDFPQPGDAPGYRPGLGQEHRPEDAPEIRPARVPEGCRTGLDGSEPYSPPLPSSPDEGDAHQMVRTKRCLKRN